MEVLVLKNQDICINWVEARRVKLEVIRGFGKEGTVIFRPNGAVRVFRQAGDLVSSPPARCWSTTRRIPGSRK